MGTSPDEAPEIYDRDGAVTDSQAVAEDLDPDDESAELDPTGGGEADLGPDDDVVAPEDMTFPPPSPDG